MQTPEILKNALSNIRKVSQAEITEDNFQRNIAELKAILFQLKDSFSTTEQLNQAEDIISYRVISQREPLERFFIRHFGTLNKHTWPIMNWNKKGKYVYDLDIIELKLAGLIHKIEQE
ncbi:hypothetical protein [Ekhidna sp.]|uniref:hypothetical protein n=1 Tax=Ekhidna sp. TaxID=2608089 RepID=UPI003C7D6EC4